MGITVGFKDQRRGPNNNVVGEVTIEWKEDVPVLGEKTLYRDSKAFDFPNGGEQEIINTPITLVSIKGTAKVRVFEKAGTNQVCVQGRVEVVIDNPLPIGEDIKIGHNLDENCHPIAGTAPAMPPVAAAALA